MKITIVLGAFLPVPPTMGGAVEKMWYSLAKEFARLGHSVTMISRKMPGQPAAQNVDGINHRRVPGFDAPRPLLWLKFLDLVYSFRVKSVLPEADILVTNTFWLPIVVRDNTRGKIYVHVGRFPKGQMRWYRRAARLQAPSSAIAEAITAESPKLSQRVSMVPYPAPRITTVRPPPIQERQKIILYVGRVHPEKGVHLLIEAFVRGTGTALKDWKLMIVGPAESRFGGGGTDYLFRLERLMGEDDRIVLAGSIFDPDQLEQIFSSARLFVYPSLAERGESFGLAPLEAMTYGCAALVSALQCFRDFIRDGETGFVFDHRGQDPAESLHQKMESIVADETLLASVAEAGHHKSAEYSPERVAELFIADFNSIVQNADARNPNR